MKVIMFCFLVLVLPLSRETLAHPTQSKIMYNNQHPSYVEHMQSMILDPVFVSVVYRKTVGIIRTVSSSLLCMDIVDDSEWLTPVPM